MNTISKTHQEFSRCLEDPRVLTNPEKFLGPNYKEVLNFWLILEELSEEQLKELITRYMDLYFNKRPEWFKSASRVLTPNENKFPMLVKRIKNIECQYIIMIIIGASCKRVEPFLDRDIYQPRYACGVKIEKFVDIENYYLKTVCQYATLELLQMCDLFEEENPLTFFEMFLNL